MENYNKILSEKTKIPLVIGSFFSFIKKIIQHRGLIRSMVERDLKNRYIGSVIGIIWSVIHPLVLLISYTFVFSVIIKHPLGPESGTTSFAIYLFCGILFPSAKTVCFLFFAEVKTKQKNGGINQAKLHNRPFRYIIL